MKKIILLGMLGLMVLIMSCSQSEEIFYSCDKTQDEWVKENLSEIRQMTRSEWLQVDETLARPVYRAFTPKQRIVFWQDKFNETKKLSWTDEELAHIQKAEDFMNSHLDFFYDNLLPQEEDELEMFFYKWFKYSVEQLGWKEEVGLGIITSGHKLRNTGGELDFSSVRITANETMSTGTETSKNCHCSVHGLLNSCGLSGQECTEGSCDTQDFGCGALWLQDCDGLCNFY